MAKRSKPKAKKAKQKQIKGSGSRITVTTKGSRSKRQHSETLKISAVEARSYYRNSAGDRREEWDDIDYFDPAEAEEFTKTGEQEGYAGATGRASVGNAIKRVFRIYPQFDSSTGQLYQRKTDLQKKAMAASLYGLFVSDDGHFILRRHLFESKKDARTGKEFSQWFRKHYGGILRETVLPHMSLKTPKTPNWRLYRVLGFKLEDGTSKRRNTGTHTKRRKAK